MSDIDYTFTGKLSNDCRSLEIDYASSIARILYPIKDVQLEIRITKFQRKRSDAQNRYCWGVLIPTVQAWQKENTGTYDSKDAIYTFFRHTIIGDEIKLVRLFGTDQLVMEGKRFSQCTVEEFAERVDKIIAYFASLGCVIPAPVPKSNNYLTDFTRLNDE